MKNSGGGTVSITSYQAPCLVSLMIANDQGVSRLRNVEKHDPSVKTGAGRSWPNELAGWTRPTIG